MSEQQRQHLSALVDSEIDPVLLHATVSALASNPELKAAWERYHLIGQVLRGEGVRPEYRQIAARVRQHIAAEPAMPASAPARRRHRARFGPFIGAAIAAAVAFLAIFAVPQLFDPGLPRVGPAIAVNPAPPTGQFALDSQDRRWHLSEPALEHKLDRLLVNHQAYSPASGIKGFFPYATVVSYESGR